METPHVGMLATYRIGSDKYAGRIIAVSPTRHRVTFQSDSGYITKECTKRRDGRYMVIGSKHGDIVLGTATQDLDAGF